MTGRASWPTQAFVVSHTHWDREWYLPVHRFRVRLVDVVRQVLDALERDPAVEHFLLDGQSVLVEDYLAVYPEDLDRLGTQVERGALAVGPWYVLPDEFLVSDEALVRNLLEGHRVARRVGRAQQVGYLPDSFGHIAQMPQILRLAGIDTFVFSRGGGDETDKLGWEFTWSAPDGRQVLAVQQCGGYCAAGGLGFEPMDLALTSATPNPDHAVARVRKLFEDMAPLSRTDVALISNGCDHLPLQRDLGAILAALRQAFPGTTFQHGSLEQYLDCVKGQAPQSPPFQGELLGGKRQFILSGVWSSRMYLKQANDEAQEALAGCAEPLAAFLHAAGMAPYPGALLSAAWRLLLRNHPHDSICGCSVDQVHRAMMPRFQGALDTGEELIRRGLARLAPEDASHPPSVPITLAVFNPLPVRRAAVVERTLAVPPGEAGDWEMVDRAGRSVPCQVVADAVSVGLWSEDYRGGWEGGRQVRSAGLYKESVAGRSARPKDASANRRAVRLVTVHALLQDLPPLGYTAVALRPRTGRGRDDGHGGVTVHSEEGVLDNGVVRVRLHRDGTLDLIHVPSGEQYHGLHRLVDEADAGDEYDFGPVAGAAVTTTAGLVGTVSRLDSSAVMGRLEWRARWSLPAAIGDDRAQRTEELVACDLRLVVTVRAGSPLVELELEIDNRACDHRLRVAFPTGVVSDTLVSDGHFFHNRRPVVRPPRPAWRQSPPETWPQQEFSLVHGAERALALLNRGLPEIQAVPGDDGVTLMLTLLRAVGWLSRDDFAARRFTNVGPIVPTPDAQCLGRRHFRYALLPGERDPVRVARASREYRVPVMVAEGGPAGAGEGADIPIDEGLLEVADPHLVVSAIKKHETRDSLVVRLSHSSEHPGTGTLRFGRPVRAAWRVDLLEERLEPVALDAEDGRLVTLSLRAWEIVSVEVALTAPAPAI